MRKMLLAFYFLLRPNPAIQHIHLRPLIARYWNAGLTAGWLGVAALALFLPVALRASPAVAIITGDRYTPDLRNQLVSGGVTVSELPDCVSQSLAPFDAVIVYGDGSNN